MNLHLQYIYNAKGKPQAVIIPLKEWKEYQAEFERMKKYVDFYQSIAQAVHEAIQIHQTVAKPRTLLDFLNEC